MPFGWAFTVAELSIVPQSHRIAHGETIHERMRNALYSDVVFVSLRHTVTHTEYLERDANKSDGEANATKHKTM